MYHETCMDRACNTMHTYVSRRVEDNNSRATHKFINHTNVGEFLLTVASLMVMEGEARAVSTRFFLCEVGG